MRRLIGGDLIARNDDRRRRIDVIEQTAQSARPRAGRYRYITNDRHLVISGHFGRFGFSSTDATSAPRVTLHQILDRWRHLASDDDPGGVAKLAEQRFERLNGVLSFAEDVVGPRENHRAHSVGLEEGAFDERSQLRGWSGNGEHWTTSEDSCRARSARRRNYFDSRRPSDLKNGFRNRKRRLGVSRYYQDLSAASSAIDAGERRGQKFRDRLRAKRQRVKKILRPRDLRRSALSKVLQFRHLNLYFATWRSVRHADIVISLAPASRHSAASPLTKDTERQPTASGWRQGASLITAIVLIKAEPQRIAQAATKLAGIEGISQVFSVSGEWDLVAMLEVAEHEAIARIVTEEVTVVPGIKSTHTLTAFRAYSKKDLEQAWDIGLE